MCESSELVVQKIRPTATCPACGHTYEFDADRICCPMCATEGGQIVGGDALELVKIDVELEERGEIAGESPALMKG
jgi:Zn finger protein HypA/HybF involved in hydrogenase expression